MSVYKYVTAEAAVRYLKTWALLITPSDQFNDPFEMRPTLSLRPASLMEQAPALVRQELAAKFSEQIAAHSGGEFVLNAEAFSDKLVSFLMRQLSASEEEQFLCGIRTVETDDSTRTLQIARDRFEQLYRQAMVDAEAQIPLFAQLAQRVMHQTLPRLIGVLCVSASSKHPLMWAHYANSHKGALLEFDEAAPCFNRRRHETDDFGFLRRVWYADSRPALTDKPSAEAIVPIALTKALEWAYEQELRLLWPLELADRRVEMPEGSIHLLDVPPAALLSVTLGCKAADRFAVEIVRLISDVGAKAKISIRKAVVDETAFSLNYRDVA